MRLDSGPWRGVPLSIALVSAVAVGALSGCASTGGRSSAQSDSERYLRLGYVQLERGQTQQALESAQQAVDKDRKNADAHNFLGIIYMSLSEFDRALGSLQEAVRINPYFTDAHNNLGVTYRELKQYDKALKEFQTALNDRNYRSPEKVQFNIGNVYLDQGVMSEAVRALQRAIDMKPDYSLAYLTLGTTYQKMGKPDLAAEQFRKVLSISPDTPEAARARQLLESGAKRGGA